MHKTKKRDILKKKKKGSVQMVLNLVNALLRLSNLIEIMWYNSFSNVVEISNQ